MMYPQVGHKNGFEPVIIVMLLGRGNAVWMVLCGIWHYRVDLSVDDVR